MSINTQGMTLPGSNTVVERVNANFASFRWRIWNFNDIEKIPHLSMLAPPLTSIASKIKWQLQIFPNGMGQTLDDFIMVSVDYYTDVNNVTADFELSITNVDDKVMEAYKVKKEIKLGMNPKVAYPRLIAAGYYSSSVRRSDIENLDSRILKDNCLTVSFDVTYHDPMVVPSVFSNKNKEIYDEERLKELDDFEELLKNGDEFSDITFVVGDTQIRAHKAILAMRSPVFKAMFQHDMQEKEKNVVKIVDIEYAVLMELFRFIYMGVIRDIENMACGLLIAAEKYCVVRLKSLCEKTLMDNLTIDNVIESLATADACNVSCLKKLAFDLILKNADEVVDRDEFGLLNPSLMHEIIRTVISKKSK